MSSVFTSFKRFSLLNISTSHHKDNKLQNQWQLTGIPGNNGNHEITRNICVRTRYIAQFSIPSFQSFQNDNNLD